MFFDNKIGKKSLRNRKIFASKMTLDLNRENHRKKSFSKVGLIPDTGGSWQLTQLLGRARAMGLDEQLGSIESGKSADLIAVDLSGPETQPVYNPLSQLVYACNGSQVTHSWVEGQLLMDQRELLTIDIQQLNKRVGNWRQTIQKANPGN